MRHSFLHIFECIDQIDAIHCKLQDIIDARIEPMLFPHFLFIYLDGEGKISIIYWNLEQ